MNLPGGVGACSYFLSSVAISTISIVHTAQDSAPTLSFW